MKNNTFIALSLASAVLSAPFIQGTLLAPGKGIHQGVIVTLKSTGDKDTTDGWGKFSFGSPITPIQSQTLPFQYHIQGSLLEIRGSNLISTEVELLNHLGQHLSNRAQTIHNQDIQIRLPQSQGLYLLRLTQQGQSQYFQIQHQQITALSKPMQSLALSPIAPMDTLIFANDWGVFDQKAIPMGQDFSADFTYWHRLLKGSYTGSASKLYLNLSNSSMGFQDSTLVQGDGSYVMNLWRSRDNNDHLLANWGVNYNLQLRDPQNQSISYSFTEDQQLVLIPTFGTSSSSGLSSSSSVSSSSLSSLSSSSVAQSSSVQISSSSITQSSSSMVPISYGSLTDARDSKVYKTVQIGTQNWMAENLNFLPVGKDQNGAWCYNNSADSCTKYGRLYNWTTMMNLADSCSYKNCSSQISYPHQGICPVGWHVASYTEWDALNAYLGGGALTGVKMKTSEWGGDNSSGFSALPAGERDPNGGVFNYIGTQAYFGFASNSKFVFDKTCYYELNKNDSYLSQCAYSWVKSYAYSVRCIQN